MNEKIKVRFHDRDPGFFDREIEPTFKAIAELLECSINQLRIRIHKSNLFIVDEFEIMAPNGHGLLIDHEDFKKVL